MILIISQEGDTTTDYVMDWVNHLKHPVLRINETDLVLHSHMSIAGTGLEYTLFGKKLNPKDIHAVWFRRDTNRYSLGVFDDIADHITREFKIYKQQFYDWLCQYDHIKILGNTELSNLNRLSVLSLAQASGFRIPNTLITTDKTKLQGFMQKHSHVMSKPMSEVFNINRSNHYAFIGPQILNENNLKKAGDTFGLSLFQEYIEKAFEVRVFYLDGQLYSMAIFSQENEQTKTDFRNYDREFPNRMEPYELPQKPSQMIRKLMKKLELNLGSIDLMVDKNGQIYFLEVNPHGQFGFVENHCNYNLYKKIAEALIN
jgi:ATP-GRASP peptide maturase of grasp-with-spasm system